MVPKEFRALVATQPMRRTPQGARVAIARASDLPDQGVSLLRRFTGETALPYLLAADEPLEQACACAYTLFRRGLISSPREPRPTSW